jgi:lipopolysaccharide transport system ATP-binding protein
VTDVAFIGNDGLERQVYEPGESLEIRIHLKVSEPVRSPVLGIMIFDDTGRGLWGTNTTLRDIDVGTIDGDRVVRWKIASLPVLNSACAVTVAIERRGGRDEYYRREKGWHFKVVSTGSDVGLVHFDATLDVSES